MGSWCRRAPLVAHETAICLHRKVPPTDTYGAGAQVEREDVVRVMATKHYLLCALISGLALGCASSGDDDTMTPPLPSTGAGAGGGMAPPINQGPTTAPPPPTT